MSIKVRRNGAWVDATIKKRVNEAWVDADICYVRTPNISGVPPFTFKSDGENLRDWSMSGQTVQASIPTPSSPVDVSGVGERTENFFNVSDYPVGTTSFITKRITLEPNTTYTMSSNCPLYNVGALIAIGNVGESFSTAKNGVYPNHPITRTADSNGELLIGLRTNNSDYTPADYDTMLNTGSTARPYEPYGWCVPVTCGGTTTNIYLGSATSTRRIKKYVFTGEENGTIYSTATSRKGIEIAGITGIIGGTADIAILAICTHYQPNTRTVLYRNTDNGISNSYQNDRIIFYDASCQTVEAFRQFCAQQYANGTPVTIWYVLAEPETAATNEPLMKIGSYADEITKTSTGVDIPTVSGSNTLSVGTTVQPSEMSIESISQWV